jgi:hypothetical protein
MGMELGSDWRRIRDHVARSSLFVDTVDVGEEGLPSPPPREGVRKVRMGRMADMTGRKRDRSRIGGGRMLDVFVMGYWLIDVHEYYLALMD